MIDNTLAINAYNANKIDALMPKNASAGNSSLDFAGNSSLNSAGNSSFASELDLALEKSTKPSAEFKAGFKEQK